MPSPKEVRDAVLKAADSRGVEQLGSPTQVPEEVRKAMHQSWLQIEHDLKIISDAIKTHPLAHEESALTSPSLQQLTNFTELSKIKMERFMTMK